MVKRNPSNMDGFVVRRRAPVNRRRLGLDNLQVPKEYLINPEHKTNSATSQPPLQTITDDMKSIQPLRHASAEDISGMGVDVDLGDVDIPSSRGKKRFRLRKPSRRTVKIIALVVVLAGLVYGGFFAWKIFNNSSKIFNGNPLAAIFSNKELKKDANGRTNMLIFGTSEDDPGDPEHGGAYLTDSIMIASFDQKKKDAYLLSVPRDLWVQFGKTCYTGYQGKINQAYLCNAGQSDATVPKDEMGGQQGFRALVGQVFGLDIQYSVHLDYTVLRQAVDAVGGVTVTIDSSDPRGILDRNFDWLCPGGRPQSCYNVKYPNGPANLDGIHALYLARARGDDPQGRTYGLGGGNFDREKYQQKILIALKDKATSAGTLANPVTTTKLLDSLGNNIRTNIDSDEIKSFIALLKDTDSSKIRTLTLIDKAKPLVTTGMASGQSIVRPVAGLFDYTGIQAYVKASLSGDATLTENATVQVLNGSDAGGVAQKQANTLSTQGVLNVTVGDAPTSNYGTGVILYDRTGGKKPATLKKLEQILGIKSAGATLPSTVTSSADFVILIGSNGVT